MTPDPQSREAGLEPGEYWVIAWNNSAAVPQVGELLEDSKTWRIDGRCTEFVHKVLERIPTNAQLVAMRELVEACEPQQLEATYKDINYHGGKFYPLLLRIAAAARKAKEV